MLAQSHDLSPADAHPQAGHPRFEQPPHWHKRCAITDPDAEHQLRLEHLGSKHQLMLFCACGWRYGYVDTWSLQAILLAYRTHRWPGR